MAEPREEATVKANNFPRDKEKEEIKRKEKKLKSKAKNISTRKKGNVSEGKKEKRRESNIRSAVPSIIDLSTARGPEGVLRGQ